MTTNTDSSGFIIHNPDRRRLALVSLKGRLNFEIKTGMKATSRGSTLQHCIGWGYDGPKRKDKALVWVTQELEKYELDVKDENQNGDATL